MKFFPLVVVLIGSLLALPARAQTGAAGEAEAQRCEERIASVQRDVLMKYDDALSDLQLGFQKSADLEGALAVRTERLRLTNEQSLSDKNFVGEPKALRALQTQTVVKVQDLVAQLVAETVPKLIELKKQLTVAGKLDDALSVRGAIEQLQNVHVPVIRPDSGTRVPAETLLLAYAGDRARADKTFKGQKITVRGVVGAFRPDPNDAKSYQVFVTGGASGGWVQCTFHAGENRFREEKAAYNVPVLVITGKDNDAGAVRLQKGSPIEVRGQCEGWDEVVRLAKCEIPK